MLRLIHNRGIVKYILASLGIAFAVYFAWSFWPFGEWVGNHFLQDAPGGPQLLGWISAVLMFGLILVIVLWKEYIKENAAAYSDATGDKSFKNAYAGFTWLVLAMELFSVLFRAIMINFSPIAFVILAVGIIGMGVTYIIGKLLHAEVNIPPEVASSRMKDSAQRSAFEEGERMVHKKKFNPFDLMRIGKGDTTPVKDAYQDQYGAKAREQAVADERRAKVEAKRKADREFYEKMTSPDDMIPSSNGKQPSNFN